MHATTTPQGFPIALRRWAGPEDVHQYWAPVTVKHPKWKAVKRFFTINRKSKPGQYDMPPHFRRARYDFEKQLAPWRDANPEDWSSSLSSVSPCPPVYTPRAPVHSIIPPVQQAQSPYSINQNLEYTAGRPRLDWIVSNEAVYYSDRPAVGSRIAFTPFERHEPATYPAVGRMDIVVQPLNPDDEQFTWPLRVRAGECPRSHPSPRDFITVADVIHAIHTCMRRTVSRATFDALPLEKQNKAVDAWVARCDAERVLVNVGQLQRVDFLHGQSVFEGISWADGGSWILHTARPVLP